MKTETICRKIYETALSFLENSQAPIAYVDILIGPDCPLTEDELIKTYNALKWNTPLTTSELEFFHTNKTDFTGKIVVLSVLEFEDEKGKAARHQIPQHSGEIDVGCGMALHTAEISVNTLCKHVLCIFMR